MGHYYFLLVVIFCLSPFIVSGIWFAWHDNKPLHRVKTEIKAFPLSKTAEDLMFKEYSYDEFKLTNRYNNLLAELKKVNLYNPQTRPADKMDVWFKKVTSQLMHDGSCLAYIDHYGWIEDMFWLNIADLGLKPEQDKEFQLLLFSIYKTKFDFWKSNFHNLPFQFGKNYQLLPEIENILNTDSRFSILKRTYEFARECAEKNKLET